MAQTTRRRQTHIGYTSFSTQLCIWKEQMVSIPIHRLYDDMIAPHVPQAKLLNLHEGKSFLSTNLCDVLSNTPETCKYSLERDAQHTREFQANTQDSFREKSKGTKQIITGYDRIAMEAARQGLINMTLITRRLAGLKCHDFHQTVLNGMEKDLCSIGVSFAATLACLSE